MVRVKRDIIHIDEAVCDSCGKCIPSCIEGALRIVDNKLILVAERFCDGCGDCVGKCPLSALKIIEQEADEWQELVYVRC